MSDDEWRAIQNKTANSYIVDIAIYFRDASHLARLSRSFRRH
jgi:hypothetical protein